MRQCQTCGSKRVARIQAKCSDMFHISADGVEHEGYVPNNIAVGEPDGCGDYVGFSYCMHCGQIQDKFPLPIFMGVNDED